MVLERVTTPEESQEIFKSLQHKSLDRNDLAALFGPGGAHRAWAEKVTQALGLDVFGADAGCDPRGFGIIKNHSSQRPNSRNSTLGCYHNGTELRTDLAPNWDFVKLHLKLVEIGVLPEDTFKKKRFSKNLTFGNDSFNKKNRMHHDDITPMAQAMEVIEKGMRDQERYVNNLLQVNLGAGKYEEVVSFIENNSKLITNTVAENVLQKLGQNAFDMPDQMQKILEALASIERHKSSVHNRLRRWRHAEPANPAVLNWTAEFLGIENPVEAIRMAG